MNSEEYSWEIPSLLSDAMRELDLDDWFPVGRLQTADWSLRRDNVLLTCIMMFRDEETQSSLHHGGNVLENTVTRI